MPQCFLNKAITNKKPAAYIRYKMTGKGGPGLHEWEFIGVKFGMRQTTESKRAMGK